MRSVTVRCCLPSPALLTWTIYFPALPPSSARGWPQTRSGSALPWTRVCHSDLAGLSSCSPLRWLGELTAGAPVAGEAAGAFLSAVPDKVSVTRRAAALPELWQGSSWHGKPAHPWRPHSITTAKGLRCSFTPFPSYNAAIPRKGNLPNLLIIISRTAKQLQH